VVAVGTSFTVEKIGSKVMVTLIQGHVVIKDAAHRPIRAQARAPISLNAGESYAASRDARAVVEPADLHAAMAWEAGQLVFKNVTLEEAVAQENRYTDKPVAVDPSVANLRVSGVFNAGEVVAFVSAVTSYLPVQATTTSDDQILLQKRP
jgi:transmembrane sensor